jgi:hypothetical protein
MGLSRHLTARDMAGMPDHQGGAVEQVRVRILPDGRMNRANASRYLGVAQKTLAMWQLQRKGPRSVLVGGRRFYYRRDLDAFVSGDDAA